MLQLVQADDHPASVGREVSVKDVAVLEERWWSGSGCCWWIGWEVLWRLSMRAALATYVRAVAGLLDPLAAAATLLLRRSKREHQAAHADSTESESSRRCTRPAGSAVVDLHADLGGARHLSATVDGRFTSLLTRAAQGSESAIRAHQQRRGRRAQPHARTHRRGCTAACAAAWIVSLTKSTGRHVPVKLRAQLE